ncbi:hypothetical protein [Streptomyces albus]|uniref:Uncharacterized protein n=1 Tax=Streptomyces albus TaxID=1888 RepID=A0A6C1C238_9ACTN|nr:hypothetical protein [Streptomyces albus]QID37044.1 hypothetical protein G3260_003366 [Streptomyces albus]TGG88146.1 hypothetical protein D8771_04420 [Streptomyces albus]UVN56035.1 hypothetical protein NR995_17060 [Streptomyces albus]
MTVGRLWRRSGGGAATAPLLATVLGAALVALALAGCSGDGAVATDGLPTAARDAGPGRAAVVAAARTLSRAGSARVRTAMEMSSGATRVTIEGHGVFDLARGTGRLRVTLPPGADGAPPGERRPVTELLTPGSLYMRNRAGVPADKWVRVATAGLPDGNLVTGGATDPLTAARLLRGARRTAFEGTAELDGVRVWHYSGVVDIERAAAGAPRQARRQLRAAEKGFSGRTVPFDAYLDGRGRLRKVQHRFAFTTDARGNTVEATAPGGRNGSTGEPAPEVDLTVTSTTTLHDFGAPVHLTMPEPGDIWAGTIAVP